MSDYGLNMDVFKEKVGCTHNISIRVQKETGQLSFIHGKHRWDMSPGERGDYWPENLIEWLVSLHV